MAYFNPTTAQQAVRDPLAVLVNEEKGKVQQITREVAQKLRWGLLPPGFTFVPCAANSRGLLGPQLQKLMRHLAEYAATHRGLGVLDGDAEETKGRLLDRWQVHLSGAAVRPLMVEYSWRAVSKRLAREAGGERLTAVDLRFQGSRRGGDGSWSGGNGGGGGGARRWRRRRRR